jgi:hypothetical protein
MFAVPSVVVFCSFLISFFPVMLHSIVWVILKWFQLPLLLLASFLLSHSTCTEFLLRVFHILKSQLLSWLHFCLQELQHLLQCIFLFYYHRLRCLVYYYYFFIIILVTTFVQGIYNYILETTRVSRSYSTSLFCVYILCYM